MHKIIKIMIKRPLRIDLINIGIDGNTLYVLVYNNPHITA